MVQDAGLGRHLTISTADQSVKAVPDTRAQRSKEELQALYLESGQAERRIAIRQGLWAAVLVLFGFSVTDFILIPDAAPLAVAARLLVGIATLFVVEFQFRSGAPARWMDFTCAVALTLAYTTWLFAAITTENTSTVSYYIVFGAIFMMAANLFFSFKFTYALGVSGTMLIASLGVIFFRFTNLWGFQTSFGVFYVSCFIFTAYVSWRLNIERYNVFLNALEAEAQTREATERGKALLLLSRTDPLTGLDNRRAVDEQLRELWSNWQMEGRSFAVVLIDVDFFKKFNDCYGHQEGDHCLMRVSDALKQTAARFHANIGRFGGEEFLVAFEHRSPEQVWELAEALRRTVEAMKLEHDQRRDGVSIVTASVGAAFTRQQPGARLERVIQEADRALYLAKASGRNCAKVFDPNDPQTSDEIENIAALLKIAIRENLVSLVYQPIHNLQNGKVDAVEALMRLRMPDGTSVPPSLFIPVAEKTGMILELGRWTIATACQELLAGDHVRMTSINVSPIQLQTPGFAASVAAVLAQHGVQGNRFAFEITEGLELEMNAETLRCISDLKRLGIKIWLDDFGTGFAGLSWVRLVDFDTVKIDRSFLDDSNTIRGRAMLKDMVVLLRNRGPRILVEGVETEAHMELMRELNIDHVQGFYLGRPAPADHYRPGIEPRHRAPVKLTRVA